jgi:hypothetical protein
VSKFDQTATENERKISDAVIPTHTAFLDLRWAMAARAAVGDPGRCAHQNPSQSAPSQRISPMSERDQTRKFTDKGAAIASETFSTAKVARSAVGRDEGRDWSIAANVSWPQMYLTGRRKGDDIDSQIE